jgi:hypothetical protein
MASFFRVFTFAFASSAIRYLVFAGIGYTVFYVLGRRLLLHRKIQSRFPHGVDYLREIAYSLTTGVIFGVVGAIIFSPAVNRHTAPRIRTTIKCFVACKMLLHARPFLTQAKEQLRRSSQIVKDEPLQLEIAPDSDSNSAPRQ